MWGSGFHDDASGEYWKRRGGWRSPIVYHCQQKTCWEWECISLCSMVEFDNFSRLEYLLSTCGVVSVCTWVGIYKYTQIYIGAINTYIKNALGNKTMCWKDIRKMCKSKRKWMLDFFFLHLGVDVLEEIVAQKSDHFVDNFKFKNQEKLKRCWFMLALPRQCVLITGFWAAVW